MQALLVDYNLQIVDDLGLKDLRIAISRCNQCTKEWSWLDLKMPVGSAEVNLLIGSWWNGNTTDSDSGDWEFDSLRTNYTGG